MRGAVIYTRMSRDRQAENDLSLSAQLEICRKYAHQNGYAVLREFEDAGESARIFRQTSLSRDDRLLPVELKISRDKSSYLLEHEAGLRETAQYTKILAG